MRPLLFILSMGIVCSVTSCKQEQKETNPFNESVCETVQKREKTTGITDLTEPGQPYSLSLCEEEFLKGGTVVPKAYGNYWKETGNPGIKQLIVNNFFTLSHQGTGQSTWQGFTVSNVYNPETKTTNENADKKWSTQADGGLINPYIPFPLEPKVQMVEGVTGAPFLIAQWNNENELSLEDINKKFEAKNFSCWIKLGEKEDYLPRGFYLSLSSLAIPDIAEKCIVIRGVDSQGKYSRATIKAPFIVPSNNDPESKNKWRWVDLSRLGKIQYLIFQVGNPNNDNKTPLNPDGYTFCIDALSVEK